MRTSLSEDTHSFYFWLNVIANMLQIESYELLLKDRTNNEVMQELQNQDTNYLEKIIKQNDEIISLLKKGD